MIRNFLGAPCSGRYHARKLKEECGLGFEPREVGVRLMEMETPGYGGLIRQAKQRDNNCNHANSRELSGSLTLQSHAPQIRPLCTMGNSNFIRIYYGERLYVQTEDRVSCPSGMRPLRCDCQPWIFYALARRRLCRHEDLFTYGH